MAPGFGPPQPGCPSAVRDENDRDEAGLPEIHVTGEGIYFLRANLALVPRASTLRGITWPYKDLVRASAT